MRWPILLALPLLLAACATPRDACLKAAQTDLAVVEGLIAETRANLERGYALQREPYTASSIGLCVGGGYGSYRGGLTYCMTPETRYRSRPVAIDRVAEQRKLTALERTRSRLLPQARQMTAQCDARFPQN